ncbi:MAG: TlpA family protein disulfide reductase [Cytophagales bacterium]|jgi:peroxiredoxin|nr:TlpA family protein disulfide reductase [Cytophagales bacterium]
MVYGLLSGKNFYEVPVKNGVFELRGKLAYPCLAIVSAEGISQEFGLWLENVTIDAVFEAAAPSYAPDMLMLATRSAKGSPDVEFYTDLHNRQKKANENSSLSPLQVMETLRSSVEQYIARHPDSYLSLFLTNNFMDEHAYGLDWGKKYMSMLNPELLQSEPGKGLQRKLKRTETNRVGTVVADFKLPDSQGKLVSLYDTKAKYVLLEFWSSWCGPCRAANPNLIKVYNAYKAKGFEIIGVSLDDSKDDWLKAVQKDGLTWTQLCDTNGWKGPVARQFSLAGIPYNILLDQNRKIVAVDLRGGELEAELGKRLAK